MEAIKLRKGDIAAGVVEAAYPEYTGRKFRLAFKERYQMENYWSDGSRTYVTAFKLEKGKLQMSTPDEVASNPFCKKAHLEFEIPTNVALVEHQFFCGKDLGVTIVVHPNTEIIPKMLKGDTAAKRHLMHHVANTIQARLFKGALVDLVA